MIDPQCLAGLAEMSAAMINVNRYQIYDSCYANKKRISRAALAEHQRALHWDDGFMGDILFVA